MSRRARSVLGVLLALTVLLWTAIASAHPTPSSTAFVDFTVDGARIEQDVPIEELQRALHQELLVGDETAEHAVARHADLLRAYVAEHVRAITPGSTAPWPVSVESVTGHASEDGPRARFLIVLEAPAGEASSSIALRDDVVAHEVVSHYILVYVRSDWASGAARRGEPRLAGTVHAGRDDVRVVRGGSFARGLWSVARLGIEHIASGTDHVLFLFMLLLAAPLRVERQRWAGPRTTRDVVGRLARVVTAFTFGHSVTLAAQTLGVVDLRPAMVEPLIAISIMVTALHLVRPLFARADVLLAGGFGLVHGLAFASALAGCDLGAVQTVWTLFGFNVGIELAQLAVLALVMPWVVLLSRTPSYTMVRRVGAAVGMLLAAGWLLERVSSHPNPFAGVVATLEGHPRVLLFSLAAAALVVSRRRHVADARGSRDGTEAPG